jgi:hypothetical protein
MNGRSLFGLSEKAIGFWVTRGDLYLILIFRRSHLWVVRGDRCLIFWNRRSGLWVMMWRSLFDFEIWAIGFVGGKGRSVIIMINQVSYIDCYD